MWNYFRFYLNKFGLSLFQYLFLNFNLLSLCINILLNFLDLIFYFFSIFWLLLNNMIKSLLFLQELMSFVNLLTLDLAVIQNFLVKLSLLLNLIFYFLLRLFDFGSDLFLVNHQLMLIGEQFFELSLKCIPLQVFVQEHPRLVLLLSLLQLRLKNTQIMLLLSYFILWRFKKGLVLVCDCLKTLVVLEWLLSYLRLKRTQVVIDFSNWISKCFYLLRHSGYLTLCCLYFLLVLRITIIWDVWDDLGKSFTLIFDIWLLPILNILLVFHEQIQMIGGGAFA